MDAYDTALRATGVKISKGNIGTVVSMFPFVDWFFRCPPATGTFVRQGFLLPYGS